MLQLKLVDVLIELSSINTHASQSIHMNAHFYSWLLFHKDLHVWDALSMVHEMSMVHSSFILNIISALFYVIWDDVVHIVWSPCFIGINCLA